MDSKVDPIAYMEELGLRDGLAPKFGLRVEGIDSDSDITEFISAFEWEHTLAMASMLTLTVNNPGFNSLLSDEEVESRKAAVAAKFSIERIDTDFVSHTIFQPGNEVALMMGYGSDADLEVGAGIIDRHLPSYPREGVPTLTIKAFDKSKFMMGVQGAITGVKQNIVQKAKAQRQRRPNVATRGGRAGMQKRVEHKTNEGETYTKMTHSEIARSFAKKYNFLMDIEDETAEGKDQRPDDLIQRKGEHDYDMLMRLAHINSFLFWVDKTDQNEEEKFGWTLHFKPPGDRGKIIRPGFLFNYATGGNGTLLEFHPEYGLDEKASEIVVSGVNRETGEPIALVEVELRQGSRANWIWRIGGGLMSRAKAYDENARFNPYRKTQSRNLGQTASAGAKTIEQLRAQTRGQGDSATKKARGWTSESQLREIQEARARAKNHKLVMATLRSASTFQLEIGGVRVSMPKVRDFTSLQDLAETARKWVYAHRDSFVIGRGRIIGIPTIRADQVHEFRGLGPRLDGYWYFVEAKHEWNEGSPYEIPFVARKII